jgi:hypothetical protein
MAPRGTPALVRLQEFYLPWFLAGTVSPDGRLIALGGRAGITLIDRDQGKEVGTVSIPDLSDLSAEAYQGISFSSDGTQLFALVAHAKAFDLRLWVWSVADGRLLREVSLDWRAGIGGPIPTGIPDLMILPGGYTGPKLDSYQYVPPFRDTEIRPGSLIELRLGSVVHKFDDCVLRWSAIGMSILAGIPTPPPAWESRVNRATADASKLPAMHVASVDCGRLEEIARPTMAAFAARPPAQSVDRSAVRIVAAESPASWLSLPPCRPAERWKARWLEADWPGSFGDNRAAVLRLEEQSAPCPRQELYWDRYDLISGRRVDEGILLWPWVQDPALMKRGNLSRLQAALLKQGPALPAAPLAALSPGGGMLAVCDPATPGRLDVWNDAGTRLVGFVATADATDVDWMGWSNDKRLLVITAGQLTAWDIPEVRPVFTVNGGYTAPSVLDPDRSWLAIAAGDHIDIIASATGQCLDRCRAGGVAGAIRDLALSSDGTKLAALFSGTSDPKQGTCAAQLWDLATGRADLLHLSDGSASPAWVDNERLAVFAGQSATLCDQKTGYALAGYWFPDVDRNGSGPLFRRASDGRMWYRRELPVKLSSRGKCAVWYSLACVDLLCGSGHLQDPDRECIFPRQFPLRVEVDLGTEARSQKVASNIVGNLQKQGFNIGPDGWTYRASYEVINSGKFFNGEDQIPAVRFTRRLFNRQQEIVWQFAYTGHFVDTLDRYFVGAGGKKYRLGADIIRKELRFVGQDVKVAISNEILDAEAEHPGYGGEIPESLLKGAHSYRALPLQLKPVPNWSPADLQIAPREQPSHGARKK